MSKQSQEYLSFVLGGENYATPLSTVQEIFQLQDIVPAPSGEKDSYLLGTVTIQNKVFPVVDMRRVVKTSASDDHFESCIIIFNNQGVEVGALVDRVDRIIEIQSQDIRSINEIDSPIYAQGQVAFKNFKLVNSGELLKKIDLVRFGIAC